MRHPNTLEHAEQQMDTQPEALQGTDLTPLIEADDAKTHVRRNVSYPALDKELSQNIIPHRRAPNKEIPQLTERQIEKFWKKVRKTEGCWIWAGHAVPCNPARTVFYGRVTLNRQIFQAHRVSYTLHYGSIPLGLTVDHVKSRGCVSTLCVNPDHLEAVTMQEQIVRRDHGKIVGGFSICKWGHIRPAGSKAKCAECARRYQNENRARKLAGPDAEAYRAKKAQARQRQRAAQKLIPSLAT